MWKKRFFIAILCVGLLFVACEKEPTEELEPEASGEENTKEIDLGEYTVMEVTDKVYLRGDDEDHYVTLETETEVKPGQRIHCYGEEEPSDPSKLVATRCEILGQSPAKIPMYRKLYREMWKQGEDITGGAETVYFEFKQDEESELFPDPLEQKLLMELVSQEVGIDAEFLPEDYEFSMEGTEDTVLLILDYEKSQYRKDNQIELTLYRTPLAAWYYVFSMDEKGGEYRYTIDEVMVS